MSKIYLISDDSPRGDGLGFEPYRDVLVESILSTKGPFTFGIMGEWGTGKTTLMQMIYEKLKKQVHKVWFNPWQYEYDENVLSCLVQKIADSLEKSKEDRAKAIREFLMSIFVALQPGVKTAIQLGFGEAVGNFAEGTINSVNGLIDSLTSNGSKVNLGIYDQLHEKLRSTGAESTKVVIFIDDLDRCLPKNALQLIEKIKLILNIPDFIFVVGLSRERIESHVQSTYGHENDPDFAAQYLDKLYQVSFHLPAAQSHATNFQRYTVRTLRSLSAGEGEFSELRDCFQFAFKHCEYNPRMLKNLINDTQIDRAVVAKIMKSKEGPAWGFFVVARLLMKRWRWLLNWLVKIEFEGDAIKAIIANPRDYLQANFNPQNIPDGNRVGILLHEHNNLVSFLKEEWVKKWLNDENARKIVIDYYQKRGEIGADSPNPPIWVYLSEKLMEKWKNHLEKIIGTHVLGSRFIVMDDFEKFCEVNSLSCRLIVINSDIGPESGLKELKEKLDSRCWQDVYLFALGGTEAHPSGDEHFGYVDSPNRRMLGSTPSDETIGNYLNYLLNYLDQ